MTSRKTAAAELRAISDAVQAIAAPSSISLISKLPDGSIIIGSGVLVQVETRAMIFTAAHVIEDAVRRGGSLQAGNGIDLAGAEAKVSPNPDKVDDETRLDAPAIRVRDGGDRLDSAWIDLTNEQAARFREEGRKFLRTSEIWTGFEHPPVAPTGVQFALHGYPVATTTAADDRSSVRTRAQFCVLPGAGPEVIAGPRELALRYRTDVQALSGDGESIEPLNPHGFSGCGVWTFPLVRLVAIFHTWDEAKGIGRATVTPTIFEALLDYDPDLARCYALKVGP